MVVLEVSIVPLGTKTPSVSKYVARTIKALQKETNVKYETTAMGTILEGDLDEVLRVVKHMHESIFGEGVERAVTTIKIDDRRDKPLSMKGKIESVTKQLQY